MLSVNPRTYYHQLAALAGWTSLLRLPRLRAHTLILVGDRDTLVQPYNAHTLRRSIPQAELRVLKGEGHFFVVTSARRTAELMLGFLGRHQDEEQDASLSASRFQIANHL